MRRALVATLLCLTCLALPASASAARGSAGKAERMVQRTIIDLNGVLRGARENLAEAADLPSIQSQDAAACQTEIAPFTDFRYTGVGAADLDGDLYCFSAGLPSPVNIADRAYFLRTIGTHGLGVGDFQIGRATGVNSIGLGYPVHDGGGALTGITISPLSLDWLGNRIARRHPPKASDSLVLDDHGTVLARAGAISTEDGTNIGGTKLARAILDEDFGVGTFDVNRVATEYAWGTVPISGGEIHAAVGVP